MGDGQDWSWLFVTLSLDVLGSREGRPLGLSSGKEQVSQNAKNFGGCWSRHSSTKTGMAKTSFCDFMELTCVQCRVPGSVAWVECDFLSVYVPTGLLDVDQRLC